MKDVLSMKDYKSEFPIFKNIANLVYLDSAATAQKPQVVIDSIKEFYTHYNANAYRGLYSLAEKATEKVEEVREKVRDFINARSSDEIIFTKNTTEGINLIAKSWGELLKRGEYVVTTVAEHHANFVPWQQIAKTKDAIFYVLSIASDGTLIFEEDVIKNAKILSLSYTNHVLGTVQDVPRIINIAKRNNPSLRVFVDAAQTVPHKRIDVQALNCDALAFSGHKMLAETGVGVLYLKKELHNEIMPINYGGHMIKEVTIKNTTFADSPAKFEAGTLQIAGIVSLGTAIDYLNKIGLDTLEKHNQRLVTYCLDRMRTLEGVRILGPKDAKKRSSIISFVVDGVHPHDIAQILGDKNICIRSGHHCAMPLHNHLGISASCRVSFYLYNTEEDIEQLLNGIKKVRKVFL
jgi:cysteine desulfurase/selenocysteine lyase